MLQNPPLTGTKDAQDRSARGVFFKTQPGALKLSDGKTFEGFLPEGQSDCYGEVVFNTGMTGYVESLTDPSYTGQILVFTYPLIGNYGVDPSAMESDRITVRGVIVSELATHYSGSKADKSLFEWLESRKIPVMTGVDTRALTKYLRSRGTMMGRFGRDPKKPSKDFEIITASIPEPIDYTVPGAKKKVILVDCGAKENIVRSLLSLPVKVRRVPFDYDFTGEDYDGVFLSNGPGDPTDYKAAIDIIAKVLKGKKPVFGICLGTQLMALASGAKTYKLKFGHRGHNQPCLEGDLQKSFMTSQNHGFAVDETTLGKDWRVTFRNLNDNSVEGIKHHSKPFSAVQFHPEACPGPTDTQWLFEEFRKRL